MTRTRFRVVGVLAAAALIAAGCTSSAASPTPAGPATKVVATVPADQLIKAGALTACSDTSYLPQETLDASNKAVGSDIDLGTELAARR